MHGTPLAQRQAQGAKILHARISAARLTAQAHQRIRAASLHHHQCAAHPQQAGDIRAPGHRFLLQRCAAYAARVAQAVSVHEVAYGLRRLCKGDKRLPYPAVLRDGLPHRLPACHGRQREHQQHQHRFDKHTLHAVSPLMIFLFRSGGDAPQPLPHAVCFLFHKYQRKKRPMPSPHFCIFLDNFRHTC